MLPASRPPHAVRVGFRRPQHAGLPVTDTMSQNLLSLSFDDQQLARIDNALAALETELQG